MRARTGGRMRSSDQPIGVAEMGPLLGVKPATVRQWLHRDHLPAPDFPSVNGRPAWRRAVVVAWAVKDGRVGIANQLTDDELAPLKAQAS